MYSYAKGQKKKKKKKKEKGHCETFEPLRGRHRGNIGQAKKGGRKSRMFRLFLFFSFFPLGA